MLVSWTTTAMLSLVDRVRIAIPLCSHLCGTGGSPANLIVLQASDGIEQKQFARVEVAHKNNVVGACSVVDASFRLDNVVLGDGVRGWIDSANNDAD